MQDQKVMALWEECRRHKMGTVAERHGMTVQQMVAEFKAAGLMGNGPKDPSPADIKRATLEVQRDWTPEIRQSRWVGARGRPAG